MLSDAFYTLGNELFVGWGEGGNHILHVGVVEHGAVDNRVVGNMVEGVA